MESEVTFLPRRVVLFPVLVALVIGTGFLVWSQSGGQPRAEAAELMDSLDLTPGASVAEVGAGSGELAEAMAGMLGDSGRLFVTEISERSLADLNARFPGEGFPQVTIVPGAEMSTNLPRDCCDAIYMRTVFHHFTEPEAMTIDLFRALLPGGRLGVIEFSPRGRRGSSSQGGHGITSEDLESQLTAAGFQIDRPAESWRGRNYIVVASKPRAPESVP